MKAVALNTESNQLELVSQPVPSPSQGEILIKVKASAITNGELTWGVFMKWPKYQTVTYDVVGTVVSTAPESRFKAGDEVYGRIDASRLGSAAEFAILLESETAFKPKNLTVEEATTVPMSAITSWQALFTQAGLKEPAANGTDKVNQGKRVLITAASGGVGIFGVQLAKLSGATVIATSGADNVDFVRSLGADEVVDYKKQSMSEWVGSDESKKFDVVIDAVGGRTLENNWSVVKEGGVLVSIHPTFKLPEGGAPNGVKGWFFIMTSDGKQLERISNHIEKGQIKSVYDSAFELGDYQKAFDRVATGHARGKVVLKL